jgi:hypothetical protein
MTLLLAYSFLLLQSTTGGLCCCRCFVVVIAITNFTAIIGKIPYIGTKH